MIALKPTDLNAEPLEVADNDVPHRLRPTRKQLLTGGALASAFLTLSRGSSARAASPKPRAALSNLDPRFDPDASGDSYDPTSSWTTPESRLVRRLTNGITSYEMTNGDGTGVLDLGYSGYLEYQLASDSIEDSDVENFIATQYPTVAMTPYQISSGGLGGAATNQLIEATIYRSIYSKRQLFWRMVEFWRDHFNIDITKSVGSSVLGTDQRDVIQANALGDFTVLLKASAHSGAMLNYLDNVNSRDTGTNIPNQNYARELMELHTLSPGSADAPNYTQQDVEQLSRILTGWSWNTTSSDPAYWTFRYNSGNHAANVDKVLLGQTITGRTGADGQNEGEDALNLLLSQPATAQFIATKMTRYLLQGDPDQSVIDAVAGAYPDIKQMIRTILTPDNLTAAPALYKRPLHLLVSAVRAAGPTITNVTNFMTTLRNQSVSVGQRPFYWSPPDGYPAPYRIDFWAGLILPRWNFASSLPNNNISGATLDNATIDALGTDAQSVADSLDARLFGSQMPSGEKSALVAFLSTGTFNTQRKRDAFGLAMATSNFQWY